MPKLQIEANELVQTDVDIVAMVKRGANRIPFRITKGDTDMTIDLGSIGRTMFSKTNATEPTIVAVVLAKSIDADEMTAFLKEAGLEGIEGLVKTDGEDAVTLTKADADLSKIEGFVLKMSDEVALVIKAETEVVKALTSYDWESTSFSEVMQKGTFSPSVSMAQEMLQRTFYNIMEKAEDTTALSKMIGTAIDEFKVYTTQLAKGLPKSVFKADAALAKGDKPWEKKKDKDAKDKDADKTDAKKADKEEISASPAVGNATPAQNGTKVDPGGVHNNDIEGTSQNNKDTHQSGTKINVGGAASSDIEGNSNTDAAGGKGQKTIGKADDAEVTADKAPDGLDALKTMMAEQFAALTTAVTDTTKALKADIAAVNAKVEKTDAALGTTVVASDTSDKTGLEKSEETHGSLPPLMDTAITKRDSRFADNVARNTRH